MIRKNFRFNRLFLLEPNLKESFGHVIEFPTALQNYLSKTGLKSYLICNRNINKNLLSTLRNAYPLLSLSCFEDTNSEGAVFQSDLNAIDKKFHLNENDLLVILTSYSNEFFGVGKFLSNKNELSIPSFAIWIHQLFPPTREFSQTLDKYFQKKVFGKLKKSFKGIRRGNKISVFSTESLLLKRQLEALFGIKVKVLPLPYIYSDKILKTQVNKSLRFGFLGDGRYEKGLLKIFRLITSSEDVKHKYILEDIFSRGYSEDDKREFEDLKSVILRDYKNVTFINKPLGSKEYKKYFSLIDCFLLPYDPKSYDKRVSGVLVEAVSNNRPVIVSSGTWMSGELAKYKNGVVFKYSKNKEAETRNIRTAILDLEKNISIYMENTRAVGKIYRKENSPENFMKLLLGDF